MANYVFRQLDNNRCYLVCMDYNSILNYLDEIESENTIRSLEGELIIDQLLVAGNGRNRFISCPFSCGKIEIRAAKNIKGLQRYKKLTTQLLKQYFNDLKYSILTEDQLEMIREGHII